MLLITYFWSYTFPESINLQTYKTRVQMSDKINEKTHLVSLLKAADDLNFYQT